MREAAEALGLPPAARLRRVELPLASRTILAGLKTAAILNVGDVEHYRRPGSAAAPRLYPGDPRHARRGVFEM